jgi:hypothetical protein
VSESSDSPPARLEPTPAVLFSVVDTISNCRKKPRACSISDITRQLSPSWKGSACGLHMGALVSVFLMSLSAHNLAIIL